MTNPEKTARHDFHESDDAGSYAYQRLKGVFAEWQAVYDRLDVLTPRQWLGLDEDNTGLKQARLDLAAILNDPGNDVPALLAIAEKGAGKLDEWDGANLREMRRIYSLYSGSMDSAKLSAYMDAMQGAGDIYVSASEVAEAGDPGAAYEMLKPVLAGIFEKKRALVQEAAAQRGMKPSELAASEWNPNIDNDDIDRIFDKAKDAYPALYAEAETALARGEGHPALPLPPVPADSQRRVVERVYQSYLEAAGWPPEKLEQAGVAVNLDLHDSTSFCWGSPREMYVAVQAPENNFIQTLANATHELGHMTYLLGLNNVPEGVRDQPVGRLNGYGTHEICASIFEQAGVSERFFEIAAPMIREELGVDGPEWSAENLYRLAQDFKRDDWSTGGPDMIPEVGFRIKAERLALDSRLSGAQVVDMLPGLWAEMKEEFSGQRPDPKQYFPDSDHWLADNYGYFYSYEHAIVAAAQMRPVMEREGVMARAAQAETLADYLRPYTEYVDNNIVSHGRKYTPLEIVKRAAGQEMDAGPFLESLRNPSPAGGTDPRQPPPWQATGPSL